MSPCAQIKRRRDRTRNYCAFRPAARVISTRRTFNPYNNSPDGIIITIRDRHFRKKKKPIVSAGVKLSTKYRLFQKRTEPISFSSKTIQFLFVLLFFSRFEKVIKTIQLHTFEVPKHICLDRLRVLNARAKIFGAHRVENINVVSFQTNYLSFFIFII